MILLS
ncbi:hypothetical protein RDI58_017927 [Solanum bulbocastanum]|jgi:hypothetical protein